MATTDGIIEAGSEQAEDFHGPGQSALASKICDYLQIPLGRGGTELFPDGELIVRVEEDVRGRDCYVVQPTCHPVNAHLMELFIWIDTLRRASAQRVTAVIPYFGYARQDQKHAGRTPITAKLVANLLERAGADRVVAVDLHAAQVQGFFDIPVDHLNAGPVLGKWFKSLKLANQRVRQPGRGKREAGPGLRGTAQRRVVLHRQAPPQRNGDRSQARHRRRGGQERPDRGRHDHHRRHGDDGVPGSAAKRGEGHLHRRDARGVCPAGDGAAGGMRVHQAGGDGHDSAGEPCRRDQGPAGGAEHRRAGGRGDPAHSPQPEHQRVVQNKDSNGI